MATVGSYGGGRLFLMKRSGWSRRTAPTSRASSKLSRSLFGLADWASEMRRKCVSERYSRSRDKCHTDMRITSGRAGIGVLRIKQRNPLGPYRRPMPKVLGASYGVGRFLAKYPCSHKGVPLASPAPPSVGPYRGTSLIRKRPPP